MKLLPRTYLSLLFQFKAQNAQEIQKYQNELLELRKKLENTVQQQQEQSSAGANSEKYRKSLKDANVQIKTLKEQIKTNKDEVRRISCVSINHT